MGDPRVEAVNNVLTSIGAHEAAYVAGAKDSMDMVRDASQFVRDQVNEQMAAAWAAEETAQQDGAGERQTALDAALREKGRISDVVEVLCEYIAEETDTSRGDWTVWACRRREVGDEAGPAPCRLVRNLRDGAPPPPDAARPDPPPPGAADDAAQAGEGGDDGADQRGDGA